VFKLRPPGPRKTTWTEQVLHRFAGAPKDGANPLAGLLLDGVDLYGTAAGGPSGLGAVFKLSPPSGGTSWTETVLHRFTGGTSGSTPPAGLIADSKGDLFGTTSHGGTGPLGGDGTVFELSPPAAGRKLWTETVLYRFKGGGDGAGPAAGLIAEAKGDLFGTTIMGGTGCFAGGCGTVFKVVP